MLLCALWPLPVELKHRDNTVVLGCSKIGTQWGYLKLKGGEGGGGELPPALLMFIVAMLEIFLAPFVLRWA